MKLARRTVVPMRFEDYKAKSNIRLGLIAARVRAGYTQETLADEIFRDRGYIANLEMGYCNGGEDTWKDIKRVLMVDNVEDLWTKYNWDEDKQDFIGDDGRKLGLNKKSCVIKDAVDADMLKKVVYVDKLEEGPV